jgi:hypothetical protein
VHELHQIVSDASHDFALLNERGLRVRITLNAGKDWSVADRENEGSVQQQQQGRATLEYFATS